MCFQHEPLAYQATRRIRDAICPTSLQWVVVRDIAENIDTDTTRRIATQARAWCDWHPGTLDPDLALGIIESGLAPFTAPMEAPVPRTPNAVTWSPRPGDAELAPWIARVVDLTKIAAISFVTPTMVDLARIAADERWTPERCALVTRLGRLENHRAEGPWTAVVPIDVASGLLALLAEQLGDDLYDVLAGAEQVMGTDPRIRLADAVDVAAGVVA